MGNETSSNKRNTRCKESHDVPSWQSNTRCNKCGEIGHTSRECDLDIVPNEKGWTNKIHDGECRSNIKCYKCGRIGHISRECERITVLNAKGCNHCGGKHASSTCRQILRKEEEERKLELEKKVEKLEGQVDKMLKLSEEDEKKGEASSKNPRDNSETNNHPLCKNSEPQLDSHNINPAIFAGTPLQFNRPPPVLQDSMCSQPQNNPPFNQSPNQPFPNLFPNNFIRPLMNPFPFPNIQQQQSQVQPTFQQPHQNVQPTPGYNQYQQSFPNNQYVQPKFNNNTESPHTSDQTTQFKKPFQNQPNHFNQKQNIAEENVNQQRGGNNGGRGNFNRGRGGNRAGWINHNDNSNWKNNNNRGRNFYNKGRGGCNRGNYNKEPQLFIGGKSNQTKTDKAEGNVPDSEKNQTERKEVDANDFRPNRNHQRVFRGGIHKERVSIKGRGTHKMQEPNKKDNSNCDSDSTGTSLETVPNTTEQQKKRKANRRKKEKKESSNDSAENTSDKNPEEVHKEDKENQPLSKNNLGEGDILMKYIGTKIPKITDAITDNISLYQKVVGVMLMSDPTSDEPILEPAKNLMHIIDFKREHPKAKSFFC